MGFDAQYERMIKRQLGGMITDYLRHINGQTVEKNKQNDNMIDTLKEFSRLSARKEGDSAAFKVLSVEEMPQVLTAKRDYVERVHHTQTVQEIDIIATKTYDQENSDELKVIGTSQGIRINETL